MAKDGMGDILTLGLIGAAVYFGWPYISQLLSSVGAAPTAPTVPPATPSAPAAPAAPSTPAVPVDPCSGQPIGPFQAAVGTGIWNLTMQTVANTLNIPIACQNELIMQANNVAALQANLRTEANAMGVSGIGRNYLRRARRVA